MLPKKDTLPKTDLSPSRRFVLNSSSAIEHLTKVHRRLALSTWSCMLPFVAIQVRIDSTSAEEDVDFVLMIEVTSVLSLINAIGYKICRSALVELTKLREVTMINRLDRKVSGL